METQRAGHIDGATVSDTTRRSTLHGLIFALTKAVKEVKARIEALEAG